MNNTGIDTMEEWASILSKSRMALKAQETQTCYFLIPSTRQI